jgi:hypothetical protein
MRTNDVLQRLSELETQMKAIEEDGTDQHIAAIILRQQLAAERTAHADHVADLCSRIAVLEAGLAKAEAALRTIMDLPEDGHDRTRKNYEIAEAYFKEFPS